MSDDFSLASMEPEDLGMFYLYGSIEETTQVEMAWWLEKLNRAVKPDHDNPLNLYIACGGGSVTSGFSMYDNLMRSKHTINTHCAGHVGSAATLPYLAGKTRYMDKHGIMLFHQHSSINPPEKHHEKLAGQKVDGWMYDAMLSLYTKHTTLTKAQAKDLLLGPSDTYLTAAECKRYGIVDKVI